MPEDLQAIIQKAADEFRWSYYRWITKQDKETIDKLFKNTSTAFSKEDLQQMTKAALTVWDEEAKKSPANKEAVDIIKKAAKEAGDFFASSSQTVSDALVICFMSSFEKEVEVFLNSLATVSLSCLVIQR